jgi:hypothetical protein
VPPSKVLLTAGLQLTVPVYWLVIRLFTAISPVVGIFTPGISNRVIVAAEVDGNITVTTPELVLCITLLDPSTVKLFATIPVKVYPAFGVNVIVAVYTELAINLSVTVGLHLIVPVYWVVSRLVTGVIPITGAVTPEIANKEIVESVGVFSFSSISSSSEIEHPVLNSSVNKIPNKTAEYLVFNFIM